MTILSSSGISEVNIHCMSLCSSRKYHWSVWEEMAWFGCKLQAKHFELYFKKIKIQKSYCSTYNNYNGKNKCTNAGFSNCMGLSKESKCGCDQVTKHNFTPKVVKRLLQENKHKKVRIFIYSPKSISSSVTSDKMLQAVTHVTTITH